VTASQNGGPGVVVLVGNPRPGSRTLAAATGIGAGIGRVTGAGAPTVIDLAGLARHLWGPPSARLGAALDQVRSAAVLVAATPVYKASLTGLLKSFLDLLPPDALRGVLAVPVSVSGAPEHRYVAELTLRPVLVELGATTPAPALGLTESQLPDLDAVLTPWLDRNARHLTAVTTA
jgi:FMN reductase